MLKMKFKTARNMLKFAAAFCTLTIAFGLVTTAHAIEIQEVETKSGIKAYLVENHTVPLIAMSFAFKGGASQDEKGKEGTAMLLSGTLDEGAGEIKSQAFQAKLDDLGVQLYFRSALDEFSGNFRTLSEHKKEAFELLRLAVNEPRFDEEPVARLKSQLLVGKKQKLNQPNEIASEIWRNKLMGDHPYAKPSDGSVESLENLSADDLRAFHKRVFAKDNLYIGVVGAITAEELKAQLEEVFGTLPDKAELNPVPEKTLEISGTFEGELDVPQTTLSIWLPGIKRNDPDFFPAFIVNHILGGGTFSSRLYQEVREKRGLTYGIGSYLATYDHMGLINFNVSTRTDRADETKKIVLEEIKRMATEGPTQEELDATKKYLSGAYAINNLDTSTKIARVLVGLQRQGLGKNYIEDRQKYIKDVTLEKTKAMAKKLLSHEPAIIIVGAKSKE